MKLELIAVVPTAQHVPMICVVVTVLIVLIQVIATLVQQVVNGMDITAAAVNRVDPGRGWDDGMIVGQHRFATHVDH